MLEWLKSIFSKEENNLQDRLLDKTAYLTVKNGTTISFNKKDLRFLTVDYTSMKSFLNNSSDDINRIYLIMSLDNFPKGNIFFNLMEESCTHFLTSNGLLTKREFASNKDDVFSKIASKFIYTLIRLIDQGYVINPPNIYRCLLDVECVLPINVLELKEEQLTENNYDKKYLVTSKDMTVTVNKLDYNVVITALSEQVKDKNN